MSKVLVLLALEEIVGAADVIGPGGILLGQSIQSIIPVGLPKGLLIPLSVSAANGCYELRKATCSEQLLVVMIVQPHVIK